jgi:hypothetical protein
MIFDWWLDLPVWGIFAALAIALALSAGCIHWLTFGKAMHSRTKELGGVVPPFFGAVAILFGLLTGFLSNDVWERNRVAVRAILAERDAILAIHAMSIATVSDMSDIRAAVEAYTKRLIDDEWPMMENQESSPKAERELNTLLAKISDPRVGAEAGAAAQGALLDTVLKLRSSRHDRLAMSGDRTDRTKWTAVLCLAFVTQIAIGIVHLEKPRAQLAALSIFSLAVIVTLGLVAIRERPFDGQLRYSSEPLAEALEVMASSPKVP